MKGMKITMGCLLTIAIGLMIYLLINSVVTPIQFEEQREIREKDVVKNLVALRTAVVEFRNTKGYYTEDLDSVIIFLKNTPKKELMKEGALTDKQLEAGLTEQKAVKIIEKAKKQAIRKGYKDGTDEIYDYIWNNDKEVIANGLQNFRRDTVPVNMIEALYKGQYDEETIEEIIYIPYTDGVKYVVETNNSFKDSRGTNIPLIQVSAPFDTYLGDLNKQELINLKDKERKLEHFEGLKFGDIDSPNGNNGNWE